MKLKSNRKRKSFQLGTAFLLLSGAFTVLSVNSLKADSMIDTAKSLGLFTIFSYVFLAISVIFFLYTLLQRD